MSADAVFTGGDAVAVADIPPAAGVEAETVAGGAGKLAGNPRSKVAPVCGITISIPAAGADGDVKRNDNNENKPGAMTAEYDTPGIMYDSGVVYADPVAPPTINTRMAKVKLGLYGLTPDGVVSLGNQVHTALTGNANFTSPNPTLVLLAALIATAAAKVAAQKAAQTAAKQATDDRDAAIDALCAALTSLASYVENTSGGDPVKIESAGMSVKNQAAPVGPLDQVQNLSITAGDNAGRLDLGWDPVRGAKSYEIQSSTDPNVLTGWTLIDSCSGSKITLTGLPSGQRTWMRVRAKAPKKVNDGAWSDPATKIVP